MSITEKIDRKRKIELDGKTWLQNSISIWSDIRKSNGESALNHPAIFPSMLASRLISVFSNNADLILDPFAGSGSTLIAAQTLNRSSIGIELSPEFIKLYEQRVETPNLFDDEKYTPSMIQGDANDLLTHVNPNSVQLTVTSPPYWDILNQRRTADYKDTKNYGNSNADLGNITSYQKFIKSLASVFEIVYEVTKKSGFCCIVLMDLRKKDKLYPFHIDTVGFMEEIGFTLDDIIIWDRRQEYNNLRPLGYPYVFRVNKVHEYILIFQKR